MHMQNVLATLHMRQLSCSPEKCAFRLTSVPQGIPFSKMVFLRILPISTVARTGQICLRSLNNIYLLD